MAININGLVLQTLNGDKEAFGKIYDHFFEKIYRFIYYRTFNKETAEDITGQTFLKALEYLKSFDPGKGRFNSWLYRIAVNCINKHFNKDRDTEEFVDIWDSGNGTDMEIDVEKKMLFEKIKPFLKELPYEKRMIVVMRIWDDMSYKEIAGILNKNESNCRMIFSRTIEELRGMMPGIMALIVILGFIMRR